MVVLNSGTATTGKLRGDTYPCYNEMLIKDNEVNINLINTKTGKKKHLARYFVEFRNEEYTICSHKHKQPIQ